MSMISAQDSQNPCPFVDFASEMTMYIFGFLNPEALACCARVCNAWKALAAEESLWKDMCDREYLAKYKEASWDWKKTFLVFSGEALSYFLNVKEPETWQAHTAQISSFYLHDTTLVSSDIDGQITFWDLANKKPNNVRTLEASRAISLQLKESTLFVGTDAGKVDFWDLTTGKPIKTLYTAQRGASVRSLELQETTLISSSFDTIQTWNISTGECLKTFVKSLFFVNSVQFHGTTLVSGGDDGVIRAWDMSTGECKKTLRGECGRVFSIQLHGTTLVSGCYQAIQIWDLDSEKCLETLKGHSKAVFSLRLQGKILVSASSDKTIKIWDISSRTCIQTLQEACDVFHFQGTTLVCAKRDGTIKIWKDLFS